ncbi:MAG: 4Fe-4S binding protein [Candidatus Wallbacteria bacterium]|nr:4Fe-4S binding protein [Candidatus Wallbacteria bacterium]
MFHKLFNEPFLPVMGSWIDGLPVVLVFLIMLIGMQCLLQLKPSKLLRMRRYIQAASLLVFVFFVYECLCVMRLAMFGLTEIGRDDLLSFAHLSIFAVVGGFAFLSGRLFCSFVCPLGFLQEIGNRITPVKTNRAKRCLLGLLLVSALCILYKTLPSNEFAVEYVTAIFALIMLFNILLALLKPEWEPALLKFRFVSLIIYGLLSASSVYFSDAWCPLYGFEIDASSIISINIVIFSSFLVTAPWCRFMCPTGLFLALIGRQALFQIELNPAGLSAAGRSSCPEAAISRDCIDRLLCINCGTCKATCGSSFGASR